MLICEDDKNIRRLMEIRLKQNGYQTFCAANGAEGLKIMDSEHIDIMIVDVMMPVLDGFTFVKTVREAGSQVPAIIVSAKGRLEDKTQGFLVGIDDYMVKPVEFDELLLRMNALLRRARIVSENKLTACGVVLDYSTLTVSSGERSVTLTKKEFSILFKLLSYPEISFTKGQLFDEFWGIDSKTDEDTVKVFINRIRSKIKDFPEIDIETIRGIGYRGVKNEK